MAHCMLRHVGSGDLRPQGVLMQFISWALGANKNGDLLRYTMSAKKNPNFRYIWLRPTARLWQRICE